MKKLGFLIFLVGASCGARAQIWEGLLFGALGLGVNAEIAKSQREVISTVKVVFDLYLERWNGELEYFCSWDPTTQTSVWFGDGVVLKVKPFSNSGPAHEHKYFVNERLVQWRKVEGGKWVRGKPSGADGVVGDYPYIRVSDLDYGYNQIKVQLSDKMWGSATFIRLDIRQFMAMAADESSRLKIAGAGGSTYPVLQSFVARMPDGTIRNFLSVEEMQMALNGQVQMPGMNPVAPKSPEPSGSYRGSGERPVATESGLTVWTGYYDRVMIAAEVRKRPKVEVFREMAAKLTESSPLPDNFSEPIPIPDGMGLAVLAMSQQKFSVSLVDREGVVLNDFSGQVVKAGNFYSVLLPLAFNDEGSGNRLVFELGQFDQAPRQLTFRRGR